MASAIYYLLLSLFTVICFVPFAVLFALTVFFDKERVALHWASRVWSYGIFRLCPLWKLRVEGREKIDRSRPWVIVTNHQSMLDIPLMYVLPKINFKWVAKSGVYKWPLFGVVLWLHGDITVDDRGSVRKTLGFMSKGLEHLHRGTSVIIAQPRRGGAQLQGGCFPARAGGGSSHPAVCHRRSQNVHQGMAGTVQHLHRAHHPARTRRKGGGDPRPGGTRRSTGTDRQRTGRHPRPGEENRKGAITIHGREPEYQRIDLQRRQHPDAGMERTHPAATGHVRGPLRRRQPVRRRHVRAHQGGDGQLHRRIHDGAPSRDAASPSAITDAAYRSTSFPMRYRR